MVGLKGQGGLEYLLLLGSALILGVIVFTVFFSSAGPQQCQGIENFDAMQKNLYDAGGGKGFFADFTSQVGCTNCFKAGNAGIQKDSTGWRQANFVFTMPKANDECFSGLTQLLSRFGATSNTAGQTVYFDDLCLEQLDGTPQTCDNNLLPFGTGAGFEDGLNSWNRQSEGTCNTSKITLSSSSCNSGNNCLKVEGENLAPVCAYWVQRAFYQQGSVNQQLLQDYGGKKMVYSYWVKSDLS